MREFERHPVLHGSVVMRGVVALARSRHLNIDPVFSISPFIAWHFDTCSVSLCVLSAKGGKKETKSYLCNMLDFVHLL
jgi:hypothetical protein